MGVRHRMAVLTLFLAALSGCERAQRFPPVPESSKPISSAPTDEKAPPVPLIYGWVDTEPELSFSPRFDIPIQFISQEANPKEWQALKQYWNETPSFPGVRTLALGLPPMEAASALATQLGVESIKIKVPRGLPDPNPLLPAVNLPTYGKWLLGKRLFFDDKLLHMSSKLTRSCADCHQPAQAFTLDVDKPESGDRNIPSLLNCIYNRHQFWDGRVEALEQVLIRQLEDEREPDKEPPLSQSPGYRHAWAGLVRRLGGIPSFLRAFKTVWGTDPNADNIAKSLATYMRTLLSGDSLVDRAIEQQKMRSGASLEPQDFAAVLDPKVLEQLPSALSNKETAERLSRGHALYHGKARCGICHGGPLFTDGEFHNIGIGESALFAGSGAAVGRFAFVPYGLKDRRLIGAFKTPSLRNVALTAPYMHDGSMATLAQVLHYFNEGAKADLSSFLDPELILGSGAPRRLELSAEDMAAIELFLRGLRGEGLPARVTEPIQVHFP
jgi:cytochrome c peroxidase